MGCDQWWEIGRVGEVPPHARELRRLKVPALFGFVVLAEIDGACCEEQYLTDGQPDLKKTEPFVISMPDNRYSEVGSGIGQAQEHQQELAGSAGGREEGVGRMTGQNEGCSTLKREIGRQIVLECSLRVAAHDADSAGCLRVSSVFNHLQNAAAMHAGKLGVGITEVLQQGLFWVLSWVKLEFAFLPRFGDEFTIRTWPKCQQKLFFIRDFLFAGSNSEVFCRATTAWLLVDVKTKKAVSGQRLREKIPQLGAEHALRCYPERFAIEDAGRSIFTREIRYSDLDVNRHVNNARFVEFIMDCYPLEHHRRHRLRSLTVAFVAEARHGDELDLRLSAIPGDGSDDFVEIRHNRSGKALVQAAVQWKPV